jgi:hypothetical protein
MTKPSICCVVPSIRPEQMESFRKVWAPLFEKHKVTLITVWDGDKPTVVTNRKPWRNNGIEKGDCKSEYVDWGNSGYADLVCRKTDAVRNLGFIEAAQEGTGFENLIPAKAGYDYILTLDDDVAPPVGCDPIQEHLDVLQRRVPISWMNTALDSLSDSDISRKRQTPYLRGFPYGIRDEAPVMVSHGVWINVPDFDGRTQLELTANGTRPQALPYALPYFRGPIPRGCLFPICGMNLMVRKEALPYLYFAPMGPDSGYPELQRFADIWMGIILKRECDFQNWAIYTGASTVTHTRASDPFKNVEQEKLGIEWNEWAWQRDKSSASGVSTDFQQYWHSYTDKASRFRKLIQELQAK